jgi:hypothetical protein
LVADERNQVLLISLYEISYKELGNRLWLEIFSVQEIKSCLKNTEKFKLCFAT